MANVVTEGFSDPILILPSGQAVYPLREDVQMDIQKRFTYHAPKNDQSERYDFLRKEVGALAMTIAQCCPPGRELALAITKLEESVFWANAAIARNE